MTIIESKLLIACTLAFFIASLCWQSAAVASESSVVGTLEATWVDPVPGSGDAASRIYSLTDDHGKQTQLSIDSELLDDLGDYFSWNGKRVRLTLADSPNDVTEVESSHRVEEVVSIWLEKPHAGRPKDQSRTHNTDSHINSGSKPWLILLCRYPDRLEVPAGVSYYESMLFDSVYGLDRYWRESSYGLMNLEGSVVFDWIELPHEEAYYVMPTQTTDEINTFLLFEDCTAAADPFVDFTNGDDEAFAGIAMVFNGVLTLGAFGGTRTATLDGLTKRWGVAFVQRLDGGGHSTFAHEMGHGMGLPHSDNADFDQSPYDNPWDVMSSSSGYTQLHPELGPLGKHTNATFKKYLGWMGPSKNLAVGDLEQVTVTIDAMAVEDSPNFRSATVPFYRSNEDFTVEVRKRIGEFDGELPGDAVIIYKNEPSRSGALNTRTVDTDIPPANFGDNEGTMFRVGETYRDEENDISITVESETIDGFVVSFDTRSANEGMPCLDANITLATQEDVDSFQLVQGPCDTVEGSLVIGGDTPYESSVENLLALVGIQSIQRDLRVQNTGALASLDGLENLEFANNVHLNNNLVLADLSALSGVESTRILQITGNSYLAELAGLESLKAVSEELEIVGNQNLDDCSSLQRLLDWVDDFDLGPGPFQGHQIPDVGGPVTIHSNKSGCNSVEEVVPLPPMPSALTGSWYEGSREGTGFMIHAVSDSLAVGYFYGFDNEGNRAWLIGVHEGLIDWDQPISFSTTYVSGGNFQDFQPDQIVEQEWGVMNFHLPNCKFGVIDIHGQFPDSEIFNGVLTVVSSLAPVSGFQCFEQSEPVQTDAVTGSWYDPQTPGQGFAIHKVSDQSGIVYYYGFDAQGTPLWLIGVWDGAVDFGSELVFPMNQVTGGTFQVVDPEQIEETPWGELRLRLDGCEAGWAELSGEDGTQEFDLVQLAGSDGFDCSE